jgi:hypothetical protein
MKRPTLLIASDEFPAPDGAPACKVCGTAFLWTVEISEWGAIDDPTECVNDTLLGDLADCVTDCFLADARCPKCEPAGWPEDADQATQDLMDEGHLDFQDWIVERVNSGTERYLVVGGAETATALIALWDEHDQIRREAMEWAAHPVLPLFQEVTHG